MGEEWWFQKLTKYKGVRHKLLLASKNSDAVAAEEIERYTKDIEREERIKKRLLLHYFQIVLSVYD